MALLPDNKNPQPAQQAAPQPKRKGTGFTNLQRILQASQGSKLGQTIAGGITGQAQQVQSGIQSAQEQFKKEAEAKRIGTEKDVERAKNVIEQAASGQEITSALPDFKRYLSGEYTGPMELANRQQLAAQAQQAETVGRLASGIGSRQGTEPGGRQQLLSRFAGGADYTSGQRKLDESILARDKDANLAAAARQTRGVAEQAQRAGAVAQQEAQQYQNLAKIFAKETREKIGEAKTPISQQLDVEVAAIQAKEDARKKFYDKLNQEIAISNTLQESPELKKQRLNSVLTQAKEGGYISEQDLKDLTTSVDMTKTEPYIQAKKELDLLNSQISTIENSIKGPYAGYIGYSEEGRKLLADLESLKNKRSQQLGNLYAASIPVSSNLMDRAIKLGMDPNQLIKDSSSFAPSLNLTRSGIADEQTSSKLNALDKLLQKQGSDLEFLAERDKYKEGEFGVKSKPFEKQILTKEVSDASSLLENAKAQFDKYKYYQYAMSSGDKKKYFDALQNLTNATTRYDKLNSALNSLITQENIEAAEKLK